MELLVFVPKLGSLALLDTLDTIQQEGYEKHYRLKDKGCFATKHEVQALTHDVQTQIEALN